MATISNTPRPGYAWDSTDNVWYPIGTGPHTHADYITSSSAINPTIVDAKGDIIAATAADTVARLAVGNNGETLVADSSTSTGLRYQPSQAAAKNAIINGGFDIWQRGTSVAGNNVGGASYWADRWNMYRSASPTAYTLSQQTTGGTTGITNYARVQRTAANTTTATMSIGQTPEILNLISLAGQPITVSFYARAGANYSPTSGALAYVLNTGTGTTSVDGIYNSLTSQATVISTTATLTTSWQRFTSTVTLGSTITQLSLQFNCTPVGTAGAADYYDLTGVTIELGSVATAFSRAGGTIQGELAACQRYYYRNTATGGAYAPMMPSGVTSSTTNLLGIVQFPVQMRSNPTSVDFSTLQVVDSAVGSYTVTNVGIVSADGNTAQCDVTISGATASRFGWVRANNNTAAYLGFSAEL